MLNLETIFFSIIRSELAFGKCERSVIRIPHLVYILNVCKYFMKENWIWYVYLLFQFSFDFTLKEGCLGLMKIVKFHHRHTPVNRVSRCFSLMCLRVVI